MGQYVASMIDHNNSTNNIEQHLQNMVNEYNSIWKDFGINVIQVIGSDLAGLQSR